MKYLNNILIIMLLSLAIVACRDEDAIRFDLDDVEEAVNFRVQIDPDFQFMDFSDIANAKLQWDAFTTSDDIDSANIYVTYYNFSLDSTFDEQLVYIYQMSMFDNEGAIREEDLTSQELADLFTIPDGVDGISGGDIINFRMEVIMEDGRVFPDTAVTDLTGTTHLNVSPGITNTAATHNFTSAVTAFVACPIDNPTEFIVGNYAFEGTPPATGWPFGVPYFHYPTDPTDTIVSLQFINTITRRLTIGHLQEFVADFETELDFLLICGNIVVPLQAGGLACAGNSLNFQTASTMPGSYDETDDGVFNIGFEDNGGCGVVGDEFTYTFTKVD